MPGTGTMSQSTSPAATPGWSCSSSIEVSAFASLSSELCLELSSAQGLPLSRCREVKWQLCAPWP